MKAEATRKLAVLLHADVVDSTRLVRKNEALAHQRIPDAVLRLSETTDAYGGIAHETRGDTLAEGADRDHLRDALRELELPE